MDDIFHTRRHTFGTMALNAGIPIESLAKMMGHASISSTQIYAQVTDRKISEDMDRLIAKQSAKKTENVEREVCEPNSRISLYINFLYVLTNHQCSIFAAVF